MLRGTFAHAYLADGPTNMKKPLSIGAREFQSSAQAYEYYKEFLYRDDPLYKLPNDFTGDGMALLQFHPEYNERFSDRNITNFEVHYAKYRTRCFHAVYADGTSDHFSFKKCIKGAVKLISV